MRLTLPGRSAERTDALTSPTTPRRSRCGTARARARRQRGDARSQGSAYHRDLFEIGASLAAEPRIDPAERSATGVPASLHDLLFDRYADAVLVADAGGRYVEANLAATTLLGYSRAELLEKRVPDVLVMSERGEAEYARFSAEGYWRGEVDLRCKDGSMVRVEARATVVETPEGSFGVAIVRESGEPLVTALATSEA